MTKELKEMYLNPELTEATVRISLGLSHEEYLELLARPREPYDEEEENYYDE